MGIWRDIAEWRGPTRNEGDGDGKPGEPEDRMVEVRGLVVHIAEGTFDGTIAWQKNPDADVSSHFIVARDGRIVQMVDTDDEAWTQRAGNGHWLSVENEGFTPASPHYRKTWERLTAMQIDANARIFAKAHQVYGAPLQVTGSPYGRGLGHHSMGAEHGVNWGHSDCPGEPIKAQKPAILARALVIVGGDMPLSAADLVAIWTHDVHDDVDGVKVVEPAYQVLMRAAADAKTAKDGLTNVGAKLAELTTAVGRVGTVVVTDEQLERVLKRVLGSVDGATPAGPSS